MLDLGMFSLGVLVNESPNDKLDICWGLKQEGPLVPSIFLFMAESLSGLMRERSDLGRLSWVMEVEDISFSIYI